MSRHDGARTNPAGGTRGGRETTAGMVAAVVAMTEAQFQSAVIALCRWLHVAVYHPYDSRRSTPGWPDLFVLGPTGGIFRELKTETGRLSTAQTTWGRELSLAGFDWGVWRPRHLGSGAIRDEIIERCGRGKAA